MNLLVSSKKITKSINAISSKSYAHRAIFCSILAKEKSVIEIDTISEDIESSLRVAKDLGCKIEIDNNKYTINPPFRFKDNLTLNVGESGTTLRFLIPLIAAIGKKAKIIRQGSLIGRTNDIYFNILPKHNVNIYEDGNNIFIDGELKAGRFEIEGNISSQFISGMLIATSYSNEESKIIIKNTLESKPYVDMTIDVLNDFNMEIENYKNEYIVRGKLKGNNFIVEKDWSNSLFFIVSGALVKGLNLKSKQGDRLSLEYLEKLGLKNKSKNGIKLEKFKSAESFRIIDAKDMPDAVPILCIISAIINGQTKVINIERLRLKESDRVKSTIKMLRAFGVEVLEEENSFSFSSVDRFSSCKINSYNDHRIAMSATIATTLSDCEVTILGAECVNKSYVGFFEDFQKLGGIVNVL